MKKLLLVVLAGIVVFASAGFFEELGARAIRQAQAAAGKPQEPTQAEVEAAKKALADAKKLATEKRAAAKKAAEAAKSAPKDTTKAEAAKTAEAEAVAAEADVKKKQEAYNALKQKMSIPTTPEYDAAVKKLSEKKEALAKAEADVKAAQEAVKTAQKAVEDARKALAAKQAEAAKQTDPKKKEEAQKQIEAANTKLADAEAALYNANEDVKVKTSKVEPAKAEVAEAEKVPPLYNPYCFAIAEQCKEAAEMAVEHLESASAFCTYLELNRDTCIVEAPKNQECFNGCYRAGRAISDTGTWFNSFLTCTEACAKRVPLKLNPKNLCGLESKRCHKILKEMTGDEKQKNEFSTFCDYLDEEVFDCLKLYKKNTACANSCIALCQDRSDAASSKIWALCTISCKVCADVPAAAPKTARKHRN